ncbi:unnamed protein product [Didymodactylos carnosus]|uniref:Uncharacterized protein n=1 Tax=Didymodactylos carnosus TaxID=1234261 RepID=A0A814ECP0_9BILA|nr:unnamed protein product [Didymodactylos carnosus]CAF3739217.1 unnamed protein product [Didymodactylos carnosus]
MITKLMFKIELCDDDSEEDDANKNKETSTETTNTTTVQPFTQPSKTLTLATTTVPKELSQQPFKITTTAKDSPPQPPSSPKKKQRLDLYGKRIDGGKWYNKLMLLLLITVVFGTVCVAFYQGCLLADVYVYADGPCPSYGVMDCYYGSSQIYFNCSVGAQIGGTLFNESAICFRFIAKDISVNDVITQFGACAGLLHALCAILQLVLRYLVYSFRKRPLTPEEIEKRVAMIAAASDEEKEKYKGTKDSNLTFKHPRYLLLGVLLFGLLLVAPIVGVALFTSFRISTSALTYILLFVIAVIGITGFICVVAAEVDNDEPVDDQQTDDSMTAENMNETAVSVNKNKKRQGRGQRPTSSFRKNVRADFDLKNITEVLAEVAGTH